MTVELDDESIGSDQHTSSWFARRWVAAVVIAGVLFGLALLNDPEAYLGTDTGGKTATLEAMVERGDWSPDVGYWAEEWDPEGEHHPFYSTHRTDEGWIQVTSLPMILGARPLWAFGGYRAALLLPILGTVLAALAAGALAARVGNARAGVAATWIFGLASPLVVYGVDLWEHSLGVAAIGWATVVLHDVVRSDRSPWTAVAAGGLLALAATMRTEALVYTAALVGGCSLWLARKDVARAVGAGAAAVVGFVPVWLANRALETALGGHSRADRATGAASGAAEEWGTRLEEGLRTTFAISAAGVAVPVVIGFVLTGAVVAAVLVGDRVPEERRHWLVVGLALGTVLTLTGGLGFVPGLFAAFPVAAAGLALPRFGPTARLLSVLAVASLPVVWAFQFTGGAGPQWGGRYVLASGFLLGVSGIVVLWRPGVPGAVRITVVAMSVAVTALGAAWLHERSHEMSDLFDQVLARQDDVLIARNPFLLREAGPAALDQRWLTVDDVDLDLEPALDVARDAGFDSVSVLQVAGDPPVDEPGTRVIRVEELHHLGGVFELVQVDLRR